MVYNYSIIEDKKEISWTKYGDLLNLGFYIYRQDSEYTYRIYINSNFYSKSSK